MTRDTVRQVIEAVTGSADADQLHLESIDVIEVVERLESLTERRVDPRDIKPENFATVAAIAAIFGAP